jgi:hypothetical protein
MWNAYLGKKLFNQKGEIKLSVFDILKENKAIGHNVNSQYIEDTRSSVLQRYCMLTFTYNLRQFSGSENRNREDDHHGSGGGGDRQRGGGSPMGPGGDRF